MNLIYGSRNAIKSVSKTQRLCYLGFDIKEKMILEEAGFELVETNKLIPEIAHSIKYDFIDYISSIGKQQQDKVNWWASRIASKSNLQTDFFSLVCLLLVYRSLIKKPQFSTVVVSDLRVYRALSQNFKFGNLRLLIFETFLSITGLFFDAIFERVRFTINHIRYNLQVRQYLKRIPKKSIFLYSWVEARSFDSEGNYENTYFSGISQLEGGPEIITFCPHLVKAQFYRNFREETVLAGLASYSTFMKILRSAFTFFRVRHISGFNGLDLKTLWNYQLWFENSVNSFIWNIHDYYCWLEFFKESSGKLIYPYENQPWEKIMIAARDAVRGKMELVGYQHSALFKAYLPFYTTPAELEYMPLPDMIVANSEKSKEHFHQQYAATSIKVVNGGSFRYNSPSVSIKTSPANNVIGVMLPIDSGQASELLYNLKKNNSGKLQFLVKPHPNYPISDIRFPAHVKLFTGSAIELFQQVNAVVYCSSTTGIEAYSYGLPVFRFVTLHPDLEAGEHEFSPVLINSFDELEDYKLKMHVPHTMFTPVIKPVWEKLLQSI